MVQKNQNLKQMIQGIILLLQYLCMKVLKMKIQTDQEQTKLTDQEIKIFEFCKEPHSKKEIGSVWKGTFFF